MLVGRELHTARLLVKEELLAMENAGGGYAECINGSALRDVGRGTGDQGQSSNRGRSPGRGQDEKNKRRSSDKRNAKGANHSGRNGNNAPLYFDHDHDDRDIGLPPDEAALEQERQRRMLFLLHRDALGSTIGALLLDRKSIRDCFYRDSERFPGFNLQHPGQRVSTETKRWLVVALVLLFLCMLGLIAWFGAVKPSQLQRAWTYSFIAWIVQDMLLVSTGEVLLVHVFFPSLIAGDMHIVHQLLVGLAARFSRNLRRDLEGSLLTAATSAAIGAGAAGPGSAASAAEGAFYRRNDHDRAQPFHNNFFVAPTIHGGGASASIHGGAENAAHSTTEVHSIAEFFAVSVRLALQFPNISPASSFIATYCSMLPPGSIFPPSWKRSLSKTLCNSLSGASLQQQHWASNTTGDRSDIPIGPNLQQQRFRSCFTPQACRNWCAEVFISFLLSPTLLQDFLVQLLVLLFPLLLLIILLVTVLNSSVCDRFCSCLCARTCSLCCCCSSCSQSSGSSEQQRRAGHAEAQDGSSAAEVNLAAYRAQGMRNTIHGNGNSNDGKRGINSSPGGMIPAVGDLYAEEYDDQEGCDEEEGGARWGPSVDDVLERTATAWDAQTPQGGQTQGGPYRLRGVAPALTPSLNGRGVPSPPNTADECSRRGRWNDQSGVQR